MTYPSPQGESVPSGDAKIFENSIARARLIHMAILVGSFTLILVIAAKTFDSGRELRKLVTHQQSLQTVAGEPSADPAA
jgi:hypothetical protein